MVVKLLPQHAGFQTLHPPAVPGRTRPIRPRDCRGRLRGSTAHFFQSDGNAYKSNTTNNLRTVSKRCRTLVVPREGEQDAKRPFSHPRHPRRCTHPIPRLKLRQRMRG